MGGGGTSHCGFELVSSPQLSLARVVAAIGGGVRADADDDGVVGGGGGDCRVLWAKGRGSMARQWQGAAR